MRRTMGVLLAWLALVPGQSGAAEAAERQRTFIRAGSLRRGERTRRLQAGCGIAGKLAGGRVPEWCRVLQPGQRLFSGGRFRPGDCGVPQGQAASPARSVSGSEPAPGPGVGPRPPARAACSLVASRLLLERLAVVPREGLRSLRRSAAGRTGGVHIGPHAPAAALRGGRRGCLCWRSAWDWIRASATARSPGHGTAW